ncbi:MAG TPA: hypothetical protein VJN67_08645 [Stellaceae bacterium]|nr:hypothetical protein [Stellaceae bacterium]
MIAMTRINTITNKTRHAATRTKTVARDLAADWKRWSWVERIVAAAIIPAVVFTVLAMSTALALGGH